MRRIVDGFRTVLTGAVGIVWTVVSVVAVLVVVLFDRNSPVIEKIIRTWSRAWLWASGTELSVEGREHIDPTRSYVVVANHLSTLDIMACLLAVPIPIRFLAKKELFRIPVLAQGMRAVGVIEVDGIGVEGPVGAGDPGEQAAILGGDGLRHQEHGQQGGERTQGHRRGWCKRNAVASRWKQDTTGKPDVRLRDGSVRFWD